MVSGGRAALILVLFFILIVIVASVYSFIGLFIGGSLEQAGTAANFSTEVQAGFTSTIANLIANIGLANSPIEFFATLLIVIMVLAIFGGLFYIVYKNKGGDKGGDMGY